MQGLPDDAATWRKEAEWGWERELAAAQIEVTDRGLRNIALLLHAQPKTLPPPVVIPRPGDDPAASKPPADGANRMSVAEFARSHQPKKPPAKQAAKPKTKPSAKPRAKPKRR